MDQGEEDFSMGCVDPGYCSTPQCMTRAFDTRAPQGSSMTIKQRRKQTHPQLHSEECTINKPHRCASPFLWATQILPWPSLTNELQGTALLRGIPSVEHPALKAWFPPRRTEMLPPSPPSAQRRKPPASVGEEGKEGSGEAAAPAPCLRRGRRGRWGPHPRRDGSGVAGAVTAAPPAAPGSLGPPPAPGWPGPVACVTRAGGGGRGPIPSIPSPVPSPQSSAPSWTCIWGWAFGSAGAADIHLHQGLSMATYGGESKVGVNSPPPRPRYALI